MKLTKNNTAFTAVFMVCATLGAKILGMLRDILIASMYGTQTAEAIAFSSASRIPVLFFDIALGSAVTSAFIPVFNEYLSNDGKAAALGLANKFINLVGIITLVLSGLGMCFSSQLVYLIAGGYEPEIQRLITSLIIILFPMIIFTGLAFCIVGILQSFDEFIVPALISLVSNGFLIVYLVACGDKFGVKGVAAAMVVAWSLQFFVQLPALYKTGFRYRFDFSFIDSGIKKILLLALPIIFSSWVQPINNLINIRLASSLAEKGSVAALDYANRLYIIFVGVFAYAVTNLIFPALSRAAGSDDNEGFAGIISTGIRYALVVIVPVMAAFLLLSKPIISLVYERGQFDAHSTSLTSSALFYYSWGMVGYALQEISNRAFYAKQDGKTPMLISVFGIGLNIVLSLIFILLLQLDHKALAFSAAISANVMGLGALYIANSRYKGIITKDFCICALKIVASSVIMIVVVALVYMLTDSIGLFIRFLICAVIGCIVYAFCTYIFKVKEITDIFTAVLKRNK